MLKECLEIDNYNAALRWYHGRNFIAESGGGQFADFSRATQKLLYRAVFAQCLPRYTTSKLVLHKKKSKSGSKSGGDKA